MLIAFQRVQGPFTFKRVQVKCQSRKELEKRIWVGSNICQKPDANEINGAAKKKIKPTNNDSDNSSPINYNFGGNLGSLGKGESTNENHEKKLASD